jgi:hypothetical protein
MTARMDASIKRALANEVREQAAKKRRGAQVIGGQDPDDREHLADQREREADERERLANLRDAVATRREHLADDRHRAANRRDWDADSRDRLADRRDLAADSREQALHQQARRLQTQPRISE